jgi:hypothetical protein
VHLEPNHLYDFEIWRPVDGENYNLMWIRDVENNPYTGGRDYECAPTSDGPDPSMGPSDLSANRSQLTASSRDLVIAVYGIPYDGNAYAPQPRSYQVDVSLDPTLSRQPGKWVDDTLGH